MKTPIEIIILKREKINHQLTTKRKIQNLLFSKENKKNPKWIFILFIYLQQQRQQQQQQQQ